MHAFRNSTPHRAWWCAVGMALCAALCDAQAQTAPNAREQEQLRRLRQQVQQLQAEQGTAQQQLQRITAEHKTLTDQLKAAQAETGQVRASAGQRSRALATLQAETAALKTERDGLQAELGRSKEGLADSQQRLQRSTTEGAELRRRITDSEALYASLRRERSVVGEQLVTCSAHNTELLQVGHDLLGRYGNFGLGETLAAREPFLQFKRVQLENLAQSYRSRIEAQRFSAPSSSTLATAP